MLVVIFFFTLKIALKNYSKKNNQKMSCQLKKKKQKIKHRSKYKYTHFH